VKALAKPVLLVPEPQPAQMIRKDLSIPKAQLKPSSAMTSKSLAFSQGIARRGLAAAQQY
jgi:hypothetical protein